MRLEREEPPLARNTPLIPGYWAYLILLGVTHSGGWGGIKFTLDLQLIHYIGSASR